MINDVCCIVNCLWTRLLVTTLALFYRFLSTCVYVAVDVSAIFIVNCWLLVFLALFRTSLFILVVVSLALILLLNVSC